MPGHCVPPPHTSPYPWLVFCNDQTQTFCSITEKATFVCSIPELGNKKVQNSCHGWLILSTIEETGSIQFFLWNPITFESIHLPSLECENTTNRFEICVLSSPPSHTDSMLFISDWNAKSIWYCFLHDHRWFKYSDTESFSISSLVSCENKIYAVTMGIWLEEIHVKNTVLARKRLGNLPLPRWKYSWHVRKDLVESCGDLFVIYIDHRERDQCLLQVIDVEIHKLDFRSMAWERVTSARNQAFFLDVTERKSGSLSVICSEALGNQIYFFDVRNCVVYSYHIEDRSLSSTSLPCRDPQALGGLFPKWIMPDRSIEILEEAVKNLGKEASELNEKEVEGREIVDKGSDRTKLVDLPHEMLKIIHDLAPTIDYLNLRQASTMCRQVAPPLQFRDAISRSENLSNSLSPWLVSLHKDGRLCTISHPHISDRYNIRVPQELQDATLWHCRDGWLLVSNLTENDTHLLSFFNPFTGHVQSYRQIEDYPMCSLQVAFSAPPTSPDCVIVALEVYCTGTVVTYVCREKEEGLSTFPPNNNHFHPTYENPIFSDGVFYFLGRHANLGVLRLLVVGWSWQVIEGPRETDPCFSESFLAERDGEVFLVLAYEMGKNIRVLSLDLSTFSWNNVENLGHYTLYVSKSSALFVVAKTSEAENKIYFPRFYGDRLISYSLSTRLIQCDGTKDSLESYNFSTQPLHCGWISPHWS